MAARMASPFPLVEGTTGLKYRSRGLSVEGSWSIMLLLSSVNDLFMWHSPTAIAQIVLHNAESFRPGSSGQSRFSELLLDCSRTPSTANGGISAHVLERSLASG